MLNWEPILEGVSSYQRFDFRPDFFLIYVNDLPNGLKIFAKQFADDISLFSVVENKDRNTNDITDDLRTISKWAYKWIMLFNPDASKHAHEVAFFRKHTKIDHPKYTLLK